jgi:hypothetical protein
MNKLLTSPAPLFLVMGLAVGALYGPDAFYNRTSALTLIVTTPIAEVALETYAIPASSAVFGLNGNDGQVEHINAF